MTTGAGALVNTVDQSHPVTAAKVNGVKHLDANARQELYASAGKPGLSTASHSYQTVYNNKIAGFTTHSFDSTFKTLTTSYVTYTGQNIHSFTVTKGQGYP